MWVVGLYMNGEKGLAVRAYGYGTSTVPVAGIVESHTGQAKVKVFDTGIEDFAPIRDDTNTGPVGFASLTIATDTRNLDDYFSDAATSGTNNNILPVIAQRSILLKADSGNSAVIRVGNSGTTGSIGFPLAAGESVELEVIRGSHIFLASASGNQTLHWLAV